MKLIESKEILTRVFYLRKERYHGFRIEMETDEDEGRYVAYLCHERNSIKSGFLYEFTDQCSEEEFMHRIYGVLEKEEVIKEYMKEYMGFIEDKNERHFNKMGKSKGASDYYYYDD